MIENCFSLWGDIKTNNEEECKFYDFLSYIEHERRVKRKRMV